MAYYINYNFFLEQNLTASFQNITTTIDTNIRTMGGWTYFHTVGDSDPTTASLPPLSNYNIWRVYTTTVSGSTWYMRFGYGRNSNGPSHTFHVGTSVDASGNLGGVTNIAITGGLPSAAQPTGTLAMSQADGRFNIGFFQFDVNRCVLYGLHANVDKTGSMTPDGMEVFYGAGAAGTMDYLPSSGSKPPRMTNWPSSFITSQSSILGGVSLVGFPVSYGQRGGNYPSPAMCIFPSLDIFPQTVLFMVPVYGQLRTYLSTFLWGQVGSGRSDAGSAMLFE